MTGVLIPQENSDYIDLDAEIARVAGGGGSQAISATTVRLSSADILALDSTPITLVPDQGDGSAVIPLCSTYWLAYGDGPAYAVGAGVAVIGPGSDFNWHADGFLSAVNAFGGTEDVFSFDLFLLSGSPAGDTASLIQNTPVTLSSTAALTEGTGTVTVVTYYIVVGA